MAHIIGATDCRPKVFGLRETQTFLAILAMDLLGLVLRQTYPVEQLLLLEITTEHGLRFLGRYLAHQLA